MNKTISIFILLLSCSLSCLGQSFGAGKFEIALSGGLSVPFADYKNVTLLPEEGGSATIGRYYKLVATYWFQGKSLGIGLSSGLSQQPFSDDKKSLAVSANRSIDVLKAEDWKVWSIVPNFSARKQWRKITLKGHLGAGLALIDGWDTYVGWFKVIFPAVTAWEFEQGRQLCLDGGAAIEFALTKRLSLGLEGNVFKTWFKAQGTKVTTTYDIFIPEMVVGYNTETITSDLNIIQMNLGVSLSWKL